MRVKRFIHLASLAGLSLGLSGCVPTPADSGFKAVQKQIGDRAGYTVQWRGNTVADAEVDRSVAHLLASPLSADAAVQIALLNNRNLQATYENLGVAQADLVQAGLLKNPIFSAGIRLPDRSPKRTYLDFSVEEDFVDLLLLPARKKLAQTQFAQTQAQVAGAVLDLAMQTRAAFVACQAAQQRFELHQTVADADAASLDAAQRLHDAGNSTELAVLQESSQSNRAQMELTLAAGTLEETRERLNDLMGLSEGQIQWTISDPLADVPDSEIDPHGLETLALRQRADLEAARQDVLAQARVLGFTTHLGFLSSVDVGAEGERETDGQWRLGPALSVPIPLFDQGQAGIARASALLRQSRDRYEALAITARSQVRQARNRLVNARTRAEFYQQQILPVQQRLLQQTQLQYNGMYVGVFQLLQARRDQVDAGREYIDALKDYWTARADLERAVGGRLPLATPATPPASRPPAPATKVMDGMDMQGMPGM